MRKMILYFAIFFIGFIAVSLWSFWLVVRPSRIVIPATPELYRLPREEVSVMTADGLKLAAWLVPRADGRSDAPAVVLLHGYPAEKADMLDLASRLHPYFAALLLDMRYFGKSQGRFTTLGFRERDDLKQAITFLKERGATDIGVFGFSLGGAVAIMSASEDERIRAVAAYAPFADLRTLGREAYSRLWLLKYPLVELMIFWGRLAFGADFTAPSPAQAAAKLTIPAFIIASREDEQIYFGHAERLESALSRNPAAEFYFLDRGRHGELPEDFEKRLIDFFSKHLD